MTVALVDLSGVHVEGLQVRQAAPQSGIVETPLHKRALWKMRAQRRAAAEVGPVRGEMVTHLQRNVPVEVGLRAELLVPLVLTHWDRAG